MSSIGPLSPGTVIDDSSVGTVAWSDPDNAKVSDDIYTTAALGEGQTSCYLKVTNFGFSIPSSATINGILVEVERKRSGVTITDSSIRIVKGGSISSTNLSTGAVWPGIESYDSFGSSSELWGESWTATDINSSDFGFVISASTAGIARTASVDHIRITVYYTELVNDSPFPSFFRL